MLHCNIDRDVPANMQLPQMDDHMISQPSKALVGHDAVKVQEPPPAGGPSTRTVIAATIAALAVSAFVNHRLARKAERDNPPAGRFFNVNGVRLHYVERGDGEPLVLLHGNGSMIQDFQSSGLIDLAAKKYRVIAFDRPGYGHSDRPRSTIWTPEAQADLIHDALAQIGIERATVLGHSWGCSVAVALAHKYPELVRGLVLASGYYYPTVRADVVGDVGSCGARWSASDALLGLPDPEPADVAAHDAENLRAAAGPAKFAGFPKAMAVRPSQIRASAAESALMVPDAFAAQGSYAAAQDAGRHHRGRR